MARIVDTLRELDLFQGLSEETLLDIGQFTKKYRFQDKAWILDTLPDSGNDLFILLEGEIDVYSRFINTKTGEPSFLGTITSGIFGELSWVLNIERTARLQCRSSVKLLSIDGSRLHGYLDAFPMVGYPVLKKILNGTASRFFHRDNLIQAMLRNEE